jgi:hypothetical protein
MLTGYTNNFEAATFSPRVVDTGSSTLATGVFLVEGEGIFVDPVAQGSAGGLILEVCGWPYLFSISGGRYGHVGRFREHSLLKYLLKTRERKLG